MIPKIPTVNVAPYKKVIAAVSALVGEFVAFAADGEISSSEWVALGVGVLGALGVYSATNAPLPPPRPAPYTVPENVELGEE